MNFNSQIATTREQSEKLLALGVNPETADMSIPIKDNPNLNCSARPYNDWNGYWKHNKFVIPAWSLSRLLEMMPPFLNKYGALYLHAGLHTERYNKDNRDIAHKYDIQYGIGSTTERYESPFEAIVEAIEWLIANGYFNKDYLK